MLKDSLRVTMGSARAATHKRAQRDGATVTIALSDSPVPKERRFASQDRWRPWNFSTSAAACRSQPAAAADVEESKNPRHEKLRKGEEIGEIYIADHLLSHHVGKPANQDRKREIVGDKKERRENDEARL